MKAGRFVSLTLALVVLIHSASSSFYNCEKGKFDTLSKLTEQCREANYAPSLRSLRKGGGSIMGSQIADMVDTYCRMSDKVNVCMEDMISLLPCLKGQKEHYQAMISRSNWMCKPGAKQEILDKLSEIPSTKMDPRDPCYRQAARKYYFCIRSYVTTSKMTAKQTAKRSLASMPCTFKSLKKICPEPKALLYTLLSYDYVIMPPGLDLNVTSTLLRLK